MPRPILDKRKHIQIEEELSSDNIYTEMLNSFYEVREKLEELGYSKDLVSLKEFKIYPEFYESLAEDIPYVYGKNTRLIRIDGVNKIYFINEDILEELESNVIEEHIGEILDDRKYKEHIINAIECNMHNYITSELMKGFICIILNKKEKSEFNEDGLENKLYGIYRNSPFGSSHIWEHLVSRE